jgi:hypothetical protein
VNGHTKSPWQSEKEYEGDQNLGPGPQGPESSSAGLEWPEVPPTPEKMEQVQECAQDLSGEQEGE